MVEQERPQMKSESSEEADTSLCRYEGCVVLRTLYVSK